MWGLGVRPPPAPCCVKIIGPARAPPVARASPACRLSARARPHPNIEHTFGSEQTFPPTYPDLNLAGGINVYVGSRSTGILRRFDWLVSVAVLGSCCSLRAPPLSVFNLTPVRRTRLLWRHRRVVDDSSTPTPWENVCTPRTCVRESLYIPRPQCGGGDKCVCQPHIFCWYEELVCDQAFPCILCLM